MKSIEKMKSCHSYFNEFLLSKGFISDEELKVLYLESGPISTNIISEEGIDLSDIYRDIFNNHKHNVRLKATIVKY